MSEPRRVLRTGGLYFNGINGYVQVENTVQLSGMNSFTVAAWVCPTKTSEGTIVSKSDNGYNKEWMLYISPITFKYHFQIYDQQAGTFVEAQGSVVESGKRCFLIGTFDGSVVKIYENGTLRNQQSTDVIIRSLTAPIRVGSRADNARFYGGVIDEVRIYSRALSNGEIQALYNGFDVRDGLVLYLSLDEGEGNIAYDRSGNNYHGILYNNPRWVVKKSSRVLSTSRVLSAGAR